MAWVNILSIIYPVGAVYFSTVNTSPASLMGGTWSQLTGGMLGLVGSEGVAAAGSNGGSRTISIDQMPSHNHFLQPGDQGRYAGWDSDPSGADRLFYGKYAPGRHIFEFYSQYLTNTGGGQDYIPAHTAVYAWKRTA